MLRGLISAIDRARRGAYYEAYDLRRRSDPNDYFTAVMVVGAVDAGILVGLLFLVAGLFSAQEAVSSFIPDSIIIKSIPELFAVVALGAYVFGLEALYFRLLSPPREIISEIDGLSVSERVKTRRMGLVYVLVAMIGGAIFAILA